MYFRARYYDAATGEFISRDPLEYVDGMSLYRGYFAPGNVDSTGEAACNCNELEKPDFELVPLHKAGNWYVEKAGREAREDVFFGVTPQDLQIPGEVGYKIKNSTKSFELLYVLFLRLRSPGCGGKSGLDLLQTYQSKTSLFDKTGGLLEDPKPSPPGYDGWYLEKFTRLRNGVFEFDVHGRSYGPLRRVGRVGKNVAKVCFTTNFELCCGNSPYGSNGPEKWTHGVSHRDCCSPILYYSEKFCFDLNTKKMAGHITKDRHQHPNQPIW